MQTTGNSSPLGATVVNGGVNFSLFSRHATGVELLLFDKPEDAKPARVIGLDPSSNRTYHYWHLFVPGLQPGQIYGYRAQGPFDPAKGMRFDAAKVLLDPYGRGVVVPKDYSRDAASEEGDNAATAMKSVVVDPSAYDWEGDAPLKRPSSRTIVYEMHVRGFTRHPSSGVAEKKRGTYAGLIEKIPYLQATRHHRRRTAAGIPVRCPGLPAGKNQLLGLCAGLVLSRLIQAYSSRQDPLGPVDEFRDMVKALHRAGIEIILDVVFNHTAEGDQRGPTLSFRGLDNNTYYILEQDRSALCQLHRHGKHAQRQPSDRSSHDRGQSPLLGRGDARGRIPVRSRVDPRAGRVGRGDGEPSGAVGYRNGPVDGGREVYCRSVGCGRAVPGGQLHRGQLERMERPVPRRCAQLLPR